MSTYRVLSTLKGWRICYWTNRQNFCSYGAHFLVGKSDAKPLIRYKVLWYKVMSAMQKNKGNKLWKAGRQAGRQNIMSLHLQLCLHQVSCIPIFVTSFLLPCIIVLSSTSKLQQAGIITLCPSSSSHLAYIQLKSTIF